MKLADLLFIVLFLATVSTLIAAAWFTLRRRFDRARRILLRLLIGAAAYMAVVIAVSMILPRRVVQMNDPHCFDDWCISVAGFKHAQEDTRVAQTVDLRLSSRARRISQRENHLAVYLIDDRGRRYDPPADASSTPFNVLLGPLESVVVSRRFLAPGDATGVGIVIAHQGGFPIGWFIIGYDTWFRKPPIAKL